MSFLAAAAVLGQLLAPVPDGDRVAARTLYFSDRSEVRLRSRLQGGDAIDLETTLGAVLSMAQPRESLRLSYGPRFSYLDIEGDRDLALIHAGRAEGAWWSRRLRLTLTLDGSIGNETTQGLATPLLPPDSAAPPPGATVTPGGVPQPAQPSAGVPAVLPTAAYFPQVLVLLTGAFRAAVGATYSFSHRWTGGASAYFAVAGGLDYDSQRYLPPYRNPGGDLSLTYAATRQDQLITRARSTYTWTLITGGNFLTIEATESIRHSWSAWTQGTLGAGMALLRSKDTSDDPHTGAIVGVGEANINHTVPLDDDATLSFRVGTALGTAYNPVLAVVQPQASAGVSSAWSRHKVRVTASADAVTSLPVDAHDVSRVASATVVGNFTVADPLQIQVGVRGYLQVFPVTIGVSYPPQWVTFVAVLLRSPLLDL